MKRILVTGAGGFIGDHLVRRLKADGHWVAGVDLKRPEFRPTPVDDFRVFDIRWNYRAQDMAKGFDEVYALAADMGGMGYISAHHAEILESNLLINLNTAAAARRASIGRLLFSSSACVYPNFLQTTVTAVGLKETDAYPADPQDAYGWEKLTAEKLYAYAAAEGAFECRIARFHNIFGPYGTWTGGREKAPAAFCRKVAEAKLRGSHEIEVWGDGRQTRSFCHVQDCVEALVRLMASDFSEPINIGQDRAVSMGWLAQTIGVIANWPVELKHVDGPEGVRGRNSDNALAKRVLDWEPLISLENGLRSTYAWIEERVKEEVRCVA